MNNGELKARIRSISQRTDLDAELQNFINQATSRINRRFGQNYSDMAVDSDTNELLAQDSDIYIYAAMTELSHFIRDWEDHDRYNARYLEEISRQNITGRSGWQTGTQYIKSELEQAVES